MYFEMWPRKINYDYYFQIKTKSTSHLAISMFSTNHIYKYIYLINIYSQYMTIIVFGIFTRNFGYLFAVF